MIQISHTYTFTGEKDSKGRHATAQGLIKTGDTVEITFMGAREEPISLERWNPVWETEDTVDVMGEVFYFRILVNGKNLLLGQWANYRYTSGSKMGGGVRYDADRTAIGDEQVRSAYAGIYEWLAKGAKENNYWHSLYTPKNFPKEAVCGMPGESVTAAENGQQLWEPDRVYEEGDGVFSVNGLRYGLYSSHLVLMPLTFGAKYSGNLVIPESVEYRKKTYPVTMISSDAFKDCDGLESISIPGTLESDFDLPTGNPPLRAINVGEECEILKSVDGVLFSKDGTRLYKYPRMHEGSEYRIPDGVESIWREAFEDAKGLHHVTFPEGLESIGSYSFRGCRNLESVVLPRSVKTVSEFAFDNCSGIKTFKFAPAQYFKLFGVPESAFPWGQPAFVRDGLTFTPAFDKRHPLNPVVKVSVAEDNLEWAASVEDLTLPGDIEQYGHTYSLRECNLDFRLFKSLRRLFIPYTVEKISLARCSATEVEIDPWNLFLCMKGCLLCNTEGTRILSVAGGMCPKKLEVPSGILKVGGFSGVGDRLEEVVLPDSVTTIEEKCFDGCRNLKDIHLGAGLVNVGDRAFAGCGITSLTLPPKLKRMAPNQYGGEHWVFDGCHSLKEFRMEEEGDLYTVIGGVLYRKYDGGNTLCVCPEQLVEGEFEVPEGTAWIESNAFAGNTRITGVELPDSLKSIEAWAFQNCTSLSTVIFGNRLRVINANAFYKCTSLEAVAVPSSVEKIDCRAFTGCRNLRILRLPEKLESNRSELFTHARC